MPCFGVLSELDIALAFLAIERDTAQYRKERIDELLNKIGQAQAIKDTEKKSEPMQNSGAIELTFTTLKFENQKGNQLGDFEVAYKQNNLPEKWQSAYNILRVNNSTIKDRYYGEGYEYRYWLYSEGRIYRQKLKKTGEKPSVNST